MARTDDATFTERNHLGVFLNSLSGPVLGLLVAMFYLAFAQYVFWLNDPVFLGAGFWPAAGISLAVLLLVPTEKWPWVLGAVAFAEFAGDVALGYSFGASGLWTLGNSIEPLVGAALIRRFSPSSSARLVPLSRLMRFIGFGVVVGPLVGATIGSLGTILFIGKPVLQVWPKFFVGDALGVLVMAPLLLAWSGQLRMRSREEASILGSATLAVTILVFRNWDGEWDVTLPYLVLPFLTWAGLRFGIYGAALSAFTVAQVANWATGTGYGPFALNGTHAITFLQLFLAIAIATALMVAALVSDLVDRREVEQQLERHNSELNAALEELERSQLQVRKLEGILPICMSCKSVRSDDDREWLPLENYLTSSDAISLSHTYCPQCREEVLQEMGEPSDP